MPDCISIPKYLTRKKIAEFYPISYSQISKLGMEENRHKGPPYLIAGGKILYRRDLFEEWLDSQIVYPAIKLKRGRPTLKEKHVAGSGVL